MAKRWHKKHISTKWGVGILGVLLLGLIVFVSQIGQTQNLFSQAANDPFANSSFVFPGSIEGVRYGQNLSIPISITMGRSNVRSLLPAPDTYQLHSVTLGKIYYDKRYFSKVNFSPNSDFRLEKSSGSLASAYPYLYIKLKGDKKISLGKNYSLGTLTMKTTNRLPPGASAGLPPIIYLKTNIAVEVCTINSNNPKCPDQIPVKMIAPSNYTTKIYIK